MRFSVCRQALVYDIGMSKPPRKKAGTKPGKKAPAWLPQPAPPLKSPRRGKVAADPPAGRRAAHPGRVPDPHAQREAMRYERPRSEEHTSELQSLMRISYAVFCLKKKKHNHILIRDEHDLTYN